MQPGLFRRYDAPITSSLPEIMNPTQVHVVPAAPGFRVIFEGGEDSPPWIGESIIAWRIVTQTDTNGELYSQTVAITPEGDFDGWAILDPSGVVVRPHAEAFESFEKVVQNWKDDRQRRVSDGGTGGGT